MKILVVSHGNLAREFVNTTKMIIGDIQDIEYLGLQANDGTDGFYEKIVNVVKASDEGLVVFADLLGGTPMLLTARAFNQAARADLLLVTGANLPMILELSSKLYLNEIHYDEVARFIEDTGHNGIKVIGKGGNK